MSIKITQCSVSYLEPDWQRQFVLSKNRLLKNLRQRIVAMSIKFDDNIIKGTGQGEIFDSVLWANPIHINPMADSLIDLNYLSKISEKIAQSVLGKEFNDPFDFEKKLYEIATTFTETFQQEHNYIVPQTLYYMALMPFSVACFSAYENATKINLYESIFYGELNNALKSLYQALIQEDMGEISIIKYNRKQIPWLMTLDISSSYDVIEQSIQLYHPKQLKVKVDNDVNKISKIIQNLIQIHHHFNDITFYFDGNRSFNTIAEFQQNFLNEIEKQEPAILDKIIGLEEITQDLLFTDNQKIHAIPYTVFIDENASSIQNTKLAADKSIGIVMKAAKPLGFLLVQYVYCIKHHLKMTVQDLTFWGNAYFANLGLYDYLPTQIGLESNYCLFVDSKWGNAYSQPYRMMTQVVNGYISMPLQQHAIFPDNNI